MDSVGGYEVFVTKQAAPSVSYVFPLFSPLFLLMMCIIQLESTAKVTSNDQEHLTLCGWIPITYPYRDLGARPRVGVSLSAYERGTDGRRPIRLKKLMEDNATRHGSLIGRVLLPV